MEIGDLLKQTRLTKGYSFEDIEEATKIRSRYLEALENEDFDLLPGQVYVIAFLRNYARFLSLNDNDLVEQYKNKTQGNNIVAKEVDENKSTVKERPRRRRKRGEPQFAKIIAVVAVIAAVFAIASIYKAYAPGPDIPEQPNVVQNNQDDQDNNKTNSNDANNETPKNNKEQPPEKTVEGVELVLNVTEANCWMRVDVDGQVAFEGTVTAGASKEFSGSESIDITLGNAGVVDVKYNGENLGKLGPRGQVINEQFKAQQG